MAVIPVILAALKGVAMFWSLLLLALSAAMIQKFNSDWLEGYYYWGSHFKAGNSVLIASIFSFIWFTLSMIFLLWFPESLVISLIVETIFLGALWCLVLATVTALSTYAGFFQACNTKFCSLGSATVGLGWILWLLIFGILAFQVTYTLVHYGGSFPVWVTPFAQLLEHGPSRYDPRYGAAASHQVPPNVGADLPMFKDQVRKGKAAVSAPRKNKPMAPV